MAKRMHPDEIVADADLVQRLLGKQFPQWAGLPLAPVASTGTDNTMFRLGDTMSVRLPRIHWAARDVEREAAWVPHLAWQLPVSVPEPIATGEPGEGYPWRWSVCRWVAGANPSVESDGANVALAEDMASFIAALQAIDPAGGPPSKRGEPLSERDAPTRAAIEAVGGEIDRAAVTASWEAALRAPSWPGARVWIHGDLSPGNALCTDGRLTGVLDFALAGLGDPATDLIPAWNLFLGPARTRFRQALAVDDATWLRGKGWALSIALIQLPYCRDTNPSLAANARHVIGQILADGPS
jgi:aminoglycoside phosphotransferase (APT) family kinase protein